MGDWSLTWVALSPRSAPASLSSPSVTKLQYILTLLSVSPFGSEISTGRPRPCGVQYNISLCAVLLTVVAIPTSSSSLVLCPPRRRFVGGILVLGSTPPLAQLGFVLVWFAVSPLGSPVGDIGGLPVCSLLTMSPASTTTDSSQGTNNGKDIIVCYDRNMSDIPSFLPSLLLLLMTPLIHCSRSRHVT